MDILSASSLLRITRQRAWDAPISRSCPVHPSPDRWLWGCSFVLQTIQGLIGEKCKFGWWFSGWKHGRDARVHAVCMKYWPLPTSLRHIRTLTLDMMAVDSKKSCNVFRNFVLYSHGYTSTGNTLSKKPSVSCSQICWCVCVGYIFKHWLMWGNYANDCSWFCILQLHDVYC